MENKYYTPSIEEFHVGFVFERYFDQNNTKGWFKVSITTINNTLDLVDSIRKEEVRVKSLDQDDIESLGFELQGEDFVSNGYHIYLAKVNVEIYAEGVSFIGTIKNKSELKRILKQVKYENG